MQENKDPDNSEENNDTPEQEENTLEGEENPSTEDTNSAESDSPFEEQEGEVLIPEKKKGSGCGLVLLLLILLGGGGTFLFYTNQLPPKVIQWVKPYYQMAESFLQEQGLLKSKPDSPSAQKWVSEVEETQEDFPASQKRFPIVKKEPKPKEEPVVEKTPPPVSEDKKHISGSASEPAPKTDEKEPPAKVSGNTTMVVPEKEATEEEPEPEPVPEEIEEEEEIEEPAPPAIPAPQLKQHAVVPVEEPSHHEAPPVKHEKQEEAERSEAVQNYLDFIEDTISKIGELIKTGFEKAKDYLIKKLG
ncbi:MAG: hypothetical protein VW455_11740 [Nitrospinota bacterium]